MKPIIDMHTHTNLSLCCHDENATLKTYVDRAAEVGVQVLGISDHCWDHPRMPGAGYWYTLQNIDHVNQIRKELPLDTKGVKVFIGVESEYYAVHDQLGMSAEGAAQFDYVLIPHSHTHMKDYVMPYDPIYQETSKQVEARMREAFPEVSDRQIEKWVSQNRIPDLETIMGGKPEPDYQFIADYMCHSFVALLENEEFKKIAKCVPTFVAHPFLAVGYSWEENQKMISLISDEKFKEMFSLMAEMGVGYDINVYCHKYEQADSCQMFRITRLARDCGVKFTFGTDAHAIDNINFAVRSGEIFAALPLTKEDLHPFYRDFVK